jgi:hypothetical protein
MWISEHDEASEQDKRHLNRISGVLNRYEAF